MKLSELNNQITGGFANSLGTFQNQGFVLPTHILGMTTPITTQPNWQNTLSKIPGMQQSYASFNATVRDVDTGNTSSPTQQQRFGPLNLDTSLPSYGEMASWEQNKKTPGLIRHDDGSFGFTRGAITNPSDKIKAINPIKPNGSPSGIVSDAIKTPEQQLDTNMQKLKSERLSSGPTMTAGQKATAFMSGSGGAAVNAAAGLVGSAMNMAGNMVGQYADRPEAQQLDETQEAVRSGIYSAVSAVPVWGPLISAGLQMTDGLGKLIGGQMSNISKDAAEDAGLNRGLNNVIATIPGVGSMLGLFTKKTDEFKFDRSRVDNISSAYDMSTFDSADDLSGGKFLGQRDKVNSFIAEQNRKKNIMTGISDTQKLRKMGASAMAADLAQQNRNRYGGVTGQQFAIGKEGMKFPNLNWARETLLKFKDGGKSPEKITTDKPKRRTLEELKAYADSVNPRFIQRANDPNLTGIDFIDDEGKKAHGTHYMEVGDDGEGHYYVYPRIQEINGKLHFFKDWRDAYDTALKNNNYLLFDNLEEADDFATNYKKVYPVFQKFQKGGKLGLDTNVIVEGSYHAHKNHLDEINPELQDITPKGIPVIAHDETGNPQQIAEIERKELILTKELTDKIEALYHDGSEEAMIEAGMLFANELFNNTEDNTGEVLNE